MERVGEVGGMLTDGVTSGLEERREQGEGVGFVKGKKKGGGGWSGGKTFLFCLLFGGAVASGFWGSRRMGGIQSGLFQNLRTVHSVEILDSFGKRGETAEIRIVKARQQEIARKVLKSWQEVKAAAMGLTHDIDRLEEILEGPMLQIWRTKATDARTKKWHWEFKLRNLKIGDVQLTPDGHRATVEATIEENAKMFDPSQPSNNDSYRDAYTVHYDLVLTETGWKICDGTVLR